MVYGFRLFDKMGNLRIECADEFLILGVTHPDDSTKIDGGNIYTGTILADSIAAGAITADKINSNAITTDKINAGAVEADKIASNAITTAKINADAITTEKIAAGAVTATEIAANAITTAKIAAGAITADEITANTITTGKIVGGAITQTVLTNTAGTVAVGTSFTLIQTRAITIASGGYISITAGALFPWYSTNAKGVIELRKDGTAVAAASWEQVIANTGVGASLSYSEYLASGTTTYTLYALRDFTVNASNRWIRCCEFKK